MAKNKKKNKKSKYFDKVKSKVSKKADLTASKILDVIDEQVDSKKLVAVCGPVGTVSGYGARSRDICTALIKSGKYDVRIIPVPWGSTPQSALDEGNPNHAQIIKRLSQSIERQPDVFIHVTIPNEFKKAGKLSIGVTAGIESTLCRHEWLQGCNVMDLVLTSSTHSKNVFENTTYDFKPKPNTNEQPRVLKIVKPIEVLFEGIDTDVFQKTTKIDPEINRYMADVVDESFCYLFVGHWLQGVPGQDRKDIGMLVKTFCDTFKTKPIKKRPALILKTSGATFSKIDELDITKKLHHILAQYPEGQRPNIYLLHGELTDAEMNSLYNHPKVKVMISFTKGEGFGRPLLEFTTTGKPVIASNWSGQVDFLSPKHSVLLEGKVGQVHESAANEWIIKESQWFTVDYGKAALTLLQVFSDYGEFLKQSKVHRNITNRDWTIEKMGEQLINYIEGNFKASRQLPELRQVPQMPKSPSELPKLKKV